MTMPPGLRLPARLLLSALVGRVRVPDPISARDPCSKVYDGRLPYSWNPKYPARVGVMPREGDNADVRWFEVEPCYVFHPMNAYDDGDTIVLTSCGTRRYSTATARDRTRGRPHWTAGPSISPTADSANRASTIVEQELPPVDERLVGKRHRYGYAPAGVVVPSDTLLKHDFLRDSTQLRRFGAGRGKRVRLSSLIPRRGRRRRRVDGLCV